MDRYQAQYNFWNGFNVTAYEENSVPDVDAVSYPYITYQAVTAPFDGDVAVNASIWTRDTSWAVADGLADAIEASLKSGGTVLNYTGGMIWVTAATPFAQSMGDPNDDRIKRKLLSVMLHFA